VMSPIWLPTSPSSRLPNNPSASFPFFRVFQAFFGFPISAAFQVLVYPPATRHTCGRTRRSQVDLTLPFRISRVPVVLTPPCSHFFVPNIFKSAYVRAALVPSFLLPNSSLTSYGRVLIRPSRIISPQPPIARDAHTVKIFSRFF